LPRWSPESPGTRLQEAFMFYSRRILGAIALLGAAACGGATRSATAAGVLAPEFAVSTTSLSTANVALLASMSSAQRMAHLVADDSMQIAMGRVAALRADNGMIRIFALHLANDHAASAQRLVDIAAQQHLSL